MSVCLLYVCPCPWKPEKSTGSPGARIPCNCELHGVGAGTKLGSSERALYTFKN